jgi:hypothetical protein
VSLNPERNLDFSVQNPRREGLTAPDSKVPATFATAYGDADSCEDRSSILAAASYDTNARTGSVRAVFFDADDAIVGVSEAVSVNATTQEDGGDPRYISEVAFIPCEGFAYYRLLLETISGGDVDLFHGTQL